MATLAIGFLIAGALLIAVAVGCWFIAARRLAAVLDERTMWED
jgi:hypothetical protein